MLQSFSLCEIYLTTKLKMCDPKLDAKSPIYIETVKKGSDDIYSHHIYEKKALLGEGAFAKVYKVVCTNVANKEKQIYALKEVAKSKITSNIRLQRVSSKEQNYIKY